MTLIDRYVGQVAQRLPHNRRHDIANELRSTLLDAMENRFGPSASENDIATLLREMGSPDDLAASYRPQNRYLVGPEWFPFYAAVLRIHLIVLSVILAAGFAATLLVPGATPNVPESLLRLMDKCIQGGLLAFGAVTLVFHIIDRSDIRPGRKLKSDWDPRELPATSEATAVSRGESIANIVFTTIGLLLLYTFKDNIGLPFQGQLLLNSVFQENLSWIGTAAALTMGLYALLLVQGRWQWYTLSIKLSLDIFGVWVVYRIAQGVIAGQDVMLEAGIAGNVVKIIAQLAAGIPPVVAVIVVLSTALHMWRILHGGSEAGVTTKAVRS